MRLAARIRQIRLERALTFHELAAKTSLTRNMIARLEEGDAVPTFEELEDLADAVGVPVYRFFFEDPESIRTPKLTPRVNWKDLTEGRESCPAPVRASKTKSRSLV